MLMESSVNVVLEHRWSGQIVCSVVWSEVVSNDRKSVVGIFCIGGVAVLNIENVLTLPNEKVERKIPMALNHSTRN